MPLQPGDKLGPYELRAPIGTGGMGEVWKACDSRLNRDVALKVLPQHLERDAQALVRFDREAKAVAALSHTNILVLYDVGADAGIHFVVTELLEGETLRDRIARGPLPWRKAAEIGAAIAEGLAAAHSKAIVHQDIKPANIFLTSDGRVKILDFGLAQVRRPPSEDEATVTLTDAGNRTVMGTIGYMSPEQVRGEMAQPPSDVFALGCVLYEMVTGRHAFTGKSSNDTLAAILKEEPPALADSGKPTSPEFQRVIERCLAKDPAQRFHSAHDLAFALRSMSSPEVVHKAASPLVGQRRRALAASIAVVILILAAGGIYYWRNRAGHGIDSLAVLPFVNSSGSSDADYLSDGITESLMDSLSQLPNLKVMSHDAVFRYKGKNPDPRTVGRELGVRAVLTGRIVQHGDRFSVSAELVDVHDNAHLWGERYDRTVADALAVQRDIAAEISGKLRARLSDERKTQIARRQTDNPEAYQLYLKGHYYISKFDTEDLNKGLDYFHQALALDPNYALAYQGIAGYYDLATDWLMPPTEAAPKEEEAARKALEIDGSLIESHLSLANQYFWYEFDWAAAEREFKRIFELDPNYALGHSSRGWYLIDLGHFDEGVNEGRRAEALDPLSLDIALVLGFDLYYAHRYDEAATQLRKCLAREPNFWPAYYWLAQVYEQQGKFPEAIAAAQSARGIENHIAAPLAELAHAYAASGRIAEARQSLEELLNRSRTGHVSKYLIATVYAALGDKNDALTRLEQAYSERSWYLGFLKSDPELDTLRSEPRFKDLLRRMNFPT
jgi:serine/threonine protein kinase/tetratricopeptide (TPR) repeat protein